MATNNEADDFAAVLAEVEAETAEEQPAEQPDEVQDEDEGQEEGDLDTGDGEGESEEDTEPLETTDNEVFKTEIADLLDKGDLKKACEKLGVDPAIFKINNRQFAAIRKAETSARRAHTEAESKLTQATEKETKAEALQRKAEEIYGPVVAGSQSAKKGDWSRAKAAVEVMFEMPFEQVVEQIKKGAKPLDPAQAEVLKLRQELAEERAKKSQEETKAAEATQYQKDIQTVTSKLAGTPLEGIEGAAEEVVKVMRASYNPGLKKYTLTLKEAYKQVKTTYQKKAEQLAKLTASAAPKPASQAAARTPLTSKNKPSSAKVTEKDEFAASIAEAAREAAAAERRMRRAR